MIKLLDNILFSKNYFYLELAGGILRASMDENVIIVKRNSYQEWILVQNRFDKRNNIINISKLELKNHDKTCKNSFVKIYNITG